MLHYDPLLWNCSFMEVGAACVSIECPPAIDPTNETSGTIMLLFRPHVVASEAIICWDIHLQPKTFTGKLQTCTAAIDEWRKHLNHHRMVFLPRCHWLNSEQRACATGNDVFRFVNHWQYKHALGRLEYGQLVTKTSDENITTPALTLYKQEYRRFDYRWGHWIFQLT
jgi:hypothetical protein